MAGILYLVGTPIGNLGDMSPRALETLREVDFIAAEDTRVTLKLLNRFEIKKPMICYFEHNRAEMGDIVRQCAEHGVTVIAIPGPSACVTALAMSGLSTQRFCFEGFLSTAGKSRREHLEELRGEKRTMIFYEAPHKLLRTLGDFLEYFGDRKIALCREMTKLHEEVIRTSLTGAIEHFTATPPKGEFVLVIEGAPEPEGPEMTAQQALEVVERYRGEGLSLKEACKKAGAETGFSKNELYSLALNK